ncbi:class I SAM-dependent methyltransferase [Aspergillus homomorphus CBS 101889]|uniref:Methyltransferase domain-containing protein n=1 Tax=Aspergillus homomorphus (strain CBS 101889) TaxID=1450537 RepID=A0A395I4X2_ASPHC|nr:hypothetical protein BO97DRAFT_433725 [Aspergillus homomorphus CBS 101889]RAL13424.1 hypothetical protein BO97DRAFT_433725 [Aspergillus homomorphus CBS 101889]
MSAIDTSVWYKSDYGTRLKPSSQFRDRAWPLGGYPCIGMWMFLLPGLAGFREFSALVERARQSDSTILDLGCGLGQDLRLLAAHGVPTERMVAVDVEPRLWELGYELFKDGGGRMQAKFIQGDFHTMTDEQLAPVQGKVDLVIAAQFLHLFSYEGQLVACKRIVALSKLGTTVVGFQQGHVRPVEYRRPWGVTFYQNRESFVKMWGAVQEETRTVWDLEVREVSLLDWGMQEEDFAWMSENRIGIEFVISRVS